jgi:protocatechuate 3,4-dioxygenase beta subunit
MRAGIWLWVWMVAAVGVPTAHGLEIMGQVVDSKARPVEGAEVAVYERYATGPFDNSVQVIGPIVKTDAQGRFQLQAKESVQYNTFVVARENGLALAWDVLNGGDNILAKKHLWLVMETPCVMAGQLVSFDGKPVANARVQALPVASDMETLRQTPILAPQEWFTTTTDAQGKFRFECFTADALVTFRANVPGSASTHVLRPHRMQAYGFEAWRSDVRLMLPRVGTIKGRVVNDRGQPVGGVELVIHPDPRGTGVVGLYVGRAIRSQPDGMFAVDDIPEGSHRIDVMASEWGPDQWVGRGVIVTSMRGQAVTDATVHVTRGGVIEFTALDARTQRPLAGARLNARGAERTSGEAVVTDSTGMARLRVPAGSYLVAVAADDFVTSRSTEQVAEGKILRRQVRLRFRPEFSGRVLDPAGLPVADVEVAINPMGDHVYTDARGRFSGHWDEQFGAQGGVVTARETKNGLTSAVQVTDWSRPADLRLSPSWTLTGKVVDPNGVGIPAARVELALEMRTSFGDLGVQLLTDSQGRFEMNAIPPTPDGLGYRLFVNASGYGPRQYMRISPSGSPGAKVNIGMIELPSADVSVMGIVVDAKGVPAASASVETMYVGPAGSGQPQPRKCTIADEKGEFTIRRLCKGPILLRASGRGGSGATQIVLPAQRVKIILGQDYH